MKTSMTEVKLTKQIYIQLYIMFHISCDLTCILSFLKFLGEKQFEIRLHLKIISIYLSLMIRDKDYFSK